MRQPCGRALAGGHERPERAFETCDAGLLNGPEGLGPEMGQWARVWDGRRRIEGCKRQRGQGAAGAVTQTAEKNSSRRVELKWDALLSCKSPEGSGHLALPALGVSFGKTEDRPAGDDGLPVARQPLQQPILTWNPCGWTATEACRRRGDGLGVSGRIRRHASLARRAAALACVPLRSNRSSARAQAGASWRTGASRRG